MGLQRLTAIAAAVVLAITSTPLVSYAQMAAVTVQVKGMVCAFWAYGVEKALKRLEGVKDVTISLEKATAKLALNEDARWRLEDAQEVALAVEKAGFKTGESLVEAKGVLAETDGKRVFIIGGTGEVCRLKEAPALQRLASLVLRPEQKVLAVIKIDNIADGDFAAMELIDFRSLELKLAPAQ